MSLRDQVIVRLDLGGGPWGGRRLESEALNQWKGLQWRWIHARIAQELVCRLQHVVLPGLSIYDVTSGNDFNGSYVDVWPGLEHFEVPEGGQLFCKWRIGTGFEVHGGAWKVKSEAGARAAVQAMRDRFRPRLVQGLKGEGLLQQRDRAGRSGMILRVVDDRWSVPHIEAHLKSLLAKTGRAIHASSS